MANLIVSVKLSESTVICSVTNFKLEDSIIPVDRQGIYIRLQNGEMKIENKHTDNAFCWAFPKHVQFRNFSFDIKAGMDIANTINQWAEEVRLTCIWFNSISLNVTGLEQEFEIDLNKSCLNQDSDEDSTD